MYELLTWMFLLYCKSIHFLLDFPRYFVCFCFYKTDWTEGIFMNSSNLMRRPMSNDRYISVIGLGRNRSFDYNPVILQVVIGLGRNWFIVVYLVVIGRSRNWPITTTTDISVVEVDFDYDPVSSWVVISLGHNRFIVVYLVVIGCGRYWSVTTQNWNRSGS